jgi:hypothetical protein
MEKFLHSTFREISRTNNLKELSFIFISSIRSRGAFDAAIDWRDAHPGRGPRRTWQHFSVAYMTLEEFIEAENWQF